VEQIITENEVLDKRFFIIIPLWSYEVGLVKTADQFQKAMNVLVPKRDHILRQLSGIGLEGKQLDTKELSELFYDIFNGTNIEKVEIQTEVTTPNISYAANMFEQPQTPQNTPTKPEPTDTILRPQSKPSPFTTTRTIHPNTPFVVEELKDEYGTI